MAFGTLGVCDLGELGEDAGLEEREHLLARAARRAVGRPRSC